jgi:hypothetical protein
MRLELRPDRDILVVRPVGSEDVVGTLRKQQVIIGIKQLSGGLVHAFVPEGLGPAAKSEPAAGILFGPAGRLHHAIERLEKCSGEFSH